MTSIRLAIVLACTFSACSNYDFAQAKLPSGEWDYRKLVADLKASGTDQLKQGLWIPLLWLDLTTFERSIDTLPEGHTLQTWQSLGPVAFYGASKRTLFDEAGEQFDWHQQAWLGWGVVWHSDEVTVQTPRGNNVRASDRFLLWDFDSEAYAGAVASR
jgi:hypothetical protein